MGRVFAYARVSTDKQDTDNQRWELENYMRRHGIEGAEIITETVSGTVKLKQRRIGILIDSLKDGDTLIVSEISRLSRNMLTIASIMQDCLSRGITIVAVKENWTLGNDPGSKFMAVAFGMAAEIERNLISQRTREALQRKKSEGVVLGRPLGVKRPQDRKLNGKDDEIVRMMRARVSNAAIARFLDVNVETLRSYIREEQLRNRVLGLDEIQRI